MQLEKELQELGLTENEAKTYLAALELGSSAITELARKTGVNRITTYDVLDSLKDAGLISQTKKGKKKLYIAAAPDALERLVLKKKTALESVLPSLLALSKGSKKKPDIFFFEGEQGMISLYQKTLDAKAELLTFGDEHHFYDLVLQKYFPKYREERIRRGIKAKMIIPDSEQGRLTKQTDKVGFRETKLVSSEKYPFRVYFLLYNQSTIIISPDELMGLYLESADITGTLKSFHRLMWEHLP